MASLHLSFLSLTIFSLLSTVFAKEAYFTSAAVPSYDKEYFDDCNLEAGGNGELNGGFKISKELSECELVVTIDLNGQRMYDGSMSLCDAFDDETFADDFFAQSKLDGGFQAACPTGTGMLSTDGYKVNPQKTQSVPSGQFKLIANVVCEDKVRCELNIEGDIKD